MRRCSKVINHSQNISKLEHKKLQFKSQFQTLSQGAQIYEVEKKIRNFLVRQPKKEIQIHKGSRKQKVLLLMAGPLRGGGVKDGPLRKKTPFFNLFFQRSKISTAIKLEGGGG